MTQILRHNRKSSHYSRRCTCCFEWIGVGNQSLQFRLSGQQFDQEYCLECCQASYPAVKAIVTQFTGGSSP